MSTAETDKAMDLIRDEMAKAHNNPGISILGEYLTDRLQGEPGIAAAILKHKEPLAFGFAAIKEHARKIAKGGYACVDDKTGFALACKALGIDTTENTSSVGLRPTPSPVRGRLENDAQAPAHGELDLDALLGGI